MIKNVLKKINQIQKQAEIKLGKVKNLQEIEELKIEYLGRKGKLNQIFKELTALSQEAKAKAGQAANAAKQKLEICFKEAQSQTVTTRADFTFDETIPGSQIRWGTLHPITQFLDKIVNAFILMGFEIVEDREVETVLYNFDKLNIPNNHPSRDMWDTFYIKRKAGESSVVLRTHTSPVQLRAMEKRKPPVRLIVPGRVYRHEATDASHETNFYQLEGLVIDKNISVANMIYVLDQILKRLFGDNVKIRIRPSFFPFVEPGFEVDMSCIICGAKGCSVCSKTGWLEMLGSGMVHPTVLRNMGVDHQKFSGFAFGMGVDRLMMLYYGVHDIRLSYSGDLRFLKQF
jgi:phenylalanyl-tRNA synthetase alpha chain